MTFSSVYEMFNPLTVVRKQRFWDWFSGDDLKALWVLRNFGTAGTAVIEDAVDSGMKITSGAGSGYQQTVGFGDTFRQFAHNGSVFISVLKRNTTLTLFHAGFLNDIDITNTDASFMKNDTTQTYIELNTGDVSAHTQTETDIAIHTNWTGVKVETGASNAKLTLDGVLKVTKTTNLPTVKQQPHFTVLAREAVAKSVNVRYVECYNT